MARELAFSNSQVETEWRRWRVTRVAETTESLTALTSAYVAYWNAVAEAWRNAVTFLKAPPPSQPSMGAGLRDSSQHVNLESIGNLWNMPPCTTNLDERETENRKEQEWSVVDLSNSPPRVPSIPLQPGGVDAAKAAGDVPNCSQSSGHTNAVEGEKEGDATTNLWDSHPLDISGEKGAKKEA